MFPQSLLGWLRPVGRPSGARVRPAARLLLERLEDRQCPSSGYLLVPSFDTHNVLRYDAATGAFVDEFVPHKSGGLNQPNALVFGPRDHDLYVTSGFYGGPGQVRAVLRYDGSTGEFLDRFTPGSLVDKVVNILFGPDGNVYVGITVEGPGTSRVARFDAATGAYLGDFVAPGSGGLQTLGGMVFGPSVENPGKLDLYVASTRKSNVLRFDGKTGAFLGEFVPAGLGGLTAAIGITFGPDGDLYVASSGALDGGPSSGVFRYQGPTGASPGSFIDTFVTPGSGGLLSPFGVLFGPDANGDGHQDLYVGGSELVPAFHSKEHTSTVKLYDGATGAYLRDFVTADSGGLGGPSHMKFTETDPMTLAYTGAPSRATAAPLSAAPATTGPALAHVNGGGQAVLTDPAGNVFPLSFGLKGVLNADGSARGAVNFVFGPAFAQLWGAVPGVDTIHLHGTVTTVAVANTGAITLQGTATEKDFARGGGVAFVEDDIPFTVVVRPDTGGFTLPWCELPTFDLKVLDGNLVIR
jgi:hypothetical protein